MRRKAKAATAGYLERVALWYLERYPGTEAKLRRALMKRVRRSVEELETDPAEGQAALEEVVAKMRRLGYLDDARLGRQRAQTLSSRGKSRRAIRADLARQGLSSDLVEETMEEIAHDELAAARRLIQRRRLGRDRDRDLARLARAGFSYDVARRALEAEILAAEAVDEEPLDEPD